MSSRAIFLIALVFPCASFAQIDDCMGLRLVKVTMQSSAFPSLPGQTVNIGVFVEPVLGTAEPTGTVHLTEGSTDLGTLPLKQAQTAISRTYVESGAHVLNAEYSGDTNYCPVIGVFGQQVDHLTPSVVLSSGAASTPYGSPATLTAQVTANPPSGVAAPSGPVRFWEGSTVLGSAPLNGGKATFTLPNLNLGPHQIVAELVGDTVWFQGRSTAINQTVTRAQTNTILTVDAGVQNTKLTANVVTDPAGPASADGTVQFVDTARNLVFGTATLPAGTATATVTVTAAQVLASVGHPIAAIYSGSPNFAPSTSIATGIPFAVNAAGPVSTDVAPDEIVSLYGRNLTDSMVQAQTIPLPVSLDGFKVTVTDSAGTDRLAGLYLTSPGQINFVVPAATLPGTAVVAVSGPGLRPPVVPIRVNVGAVAPGIFTITSDGNGTPAAQIVRVRADGSQTLETVSASGIRIGSDSLYLILYGTGIRNRSSLSAVTCAIGGQSATVSYAGTQPDSPGLDQVNVLLPAVLAGKGTVSLTLTVNGQASNSVTLNLL